MVQSSILWYTSQIAATARVDPGWTQEVFPGPLMWVQETKSLGCHLLLFPGTLAGNWTGSGAIGTWTGPRIECHHCWQWLNLLHRNSGSKEFYLSEPQLNPTSGLSLRHLLGDEWYCSTMERGTWFLLQRREGLGELPGAINIWSQQLGHVSLSPLHNAQSWAPSTGCSIKSVDLNNLLKVCGRVSMHSRQGILLCFLSHELGWKVTLISRYKGCLYWIIPLTSAYTLTSSFHDLCHEFHVIILVNLLL